MPGFNGQGPVWGGGPGGGWGIGPCGLGRGFRRGMGRRARWFGYNAYDNEADYLKNEAKLLDEELKEIKKRIEELEKSK